MRDEQGPRTRWTFLTHHARVLVAISRDAEIRLRDLAATCGVTERAVQAIITDLENAGFLTRTRHGRRNHYDVVGGTYFRHPAEAHQEIAGLLALFGGPDPRPGSGHQQTLPTGDHHGQHP
ncbi:helix-turn-helix transcriptional regulator [Kitasatospora cheerisanensis]|uniref:helix-turn-helix transcriptional regulator n=1 Tax=Kitasatospora cheerisanensis TaxID=81942 RepID=UPI00068D0A6D|nr:helix-turn-helix domain-containing protein [Kitasatospora cheerisanensis]